MEMLRPMNMTGMPGVSLMAMATPPFAVPSNLARERPVTAAAALSFPRLGLGHPRVASRQDVLTADQTHHFVVRARTDHLKASHSREYMLILSRC